MEVKVTAFTELNDNLEVFSMLDIRHRREVLAVVTIPLCVSAPGPGEILRILSRETEAGGRGQAASASLGRVTLITSPGPGTSISPGASGLNMLH